MKKKFIIVLSIFSFQVFWSQTDKNFHQFNNKNHQPKIGLVLSGGGAKGFAHIGVLKVLEKYHIHPDFIGGTSMGAIIGSLYASGYSAQQIDSIFHTLDFDAILYNRYDRKYKNYFIKEYGNKYVFSFPFSFRKNTIQLPRGLSNSQSLFNVLANNLLHVSNVNDFSELKIPFLCPATDIVNGKQVLFIKGYLPEAVTSSALLPSFFVPLEIDKKLLLDGGIVNNYPVKEIKDIGAEFIIGSDVQGNLLEKEDISNMPAIMDQILSFSIYKEMPYKKAITDLYIRPDMSNIGLTDFDKIDEIIKNGEKTTEKAIKNLSDLQNIQSFKKTTPLHFKKPDSLIFDQIVIEGLMNFKREYVLGKIDIKPYKKISYQDFLDGINTLTGTENFEMIHYRIAKDKKRNILFLKIKEKQDKATMSLGFHYNDLYEINVIGSFKNKRIFTSNDWFSLDLIGGNNFRYNFNYVIDNGFQLSWGFHSGLHHFGKNVFVDEIFEEENYSINKLDFNFLKLENKLFFQGNLSHFIYLRIGAQHHYKELFTYVFSGEKNKPFYFGKNHYFGNFVLVNFDSRDDFDFPKKGTYFKLKWNYFWSSSDFYNSFTPYSTYSAEFNYNQQIGKYLSIHPEIKAGIHYGKQHLKENMFYLGGIDKYLNFDQITSFEPTPILSIDATKFGVFSLNNRFEFYKNHYLTFNTSFLIYDDSDLFLSTNSKKVFGYNIGYGFKSFLGPLKLIYGVIPKSHKQHLTFSFGYTF